MKIASVLTLGEDDWVGPLGARSGRVPAGTKEMFLYPCGAICLHRPQNVFDAADGDDDPVGTVV
jgi:hypothetical protein